MSRPLVEVVCVGSIVRDGGQILEAHSTCTVVRTRHHTILVDTSDRTYRPRLLEGLQRSGLETKDIDILVCTHGHHDHTGNIDLFPQAEMYAHPADGPRGLFISVREEMQLGDGVRLVPTPGHSPGSISVFVEGEEKTAVAGDAVPTEDNYLKNVPPAHHFDREMAVASMRNIIDWADVIVPGHGPAFHVKH